MKHITQIDGESRFFTGYNNQGDSVYLYKPTYKGNGIWSTGYIGTQEYRVQWKHLADSVNIAQALTDYIRLSPFIEQRLQSLAKAQQTIYGLQALSENTSKTRTERLVFNIIPKKCQELWNMLEKR